MSQQLRLAIARVYQFKGKRTLSRTEVANCVAFDLRWFSPPDAAKLVDAAVAAGILTGETAALAPSFDPKAVAVPMRFEPTAAVLSYKRDASAFAATLAALQQRCPGVPTAELLMAINHLHERTLLEPRVAALLVAGSRDVELDPLIALVRTELAQERAAVPRRAPERGAHEARH